MAFNSMLLATCLLALTASLVARAQNVPQNTTQVYQFATLQVCDWPSNPPFIKDNSTPVSQWQNVQEWQYSDWRDWAQNDLKDKWIPSAVFLGIGVLSALIYIIWRLIDSCFTCCRRNRNHEKFQAASPYSAQTPGRRRGWWHRTNSGKGMMWLKPFVTLLALGVLGVSIWGLTLASKGLADNAWNRVDAFRDQVNLVADDVDVLLANVGNVSTAITTLQDTVNNLPSIPTIPGVNVNIPTDQLKSTVTGPLGSAKDSLNGLVQTYVNQTEQIRLDIIGQIDKAQSNYEHPTQQMDTAQFVITIVLFTLAIVVMVELIVGMFTNVPALVSAAVWCANIIMVLLFAAALLMALGLSGSRDACPAAETIFKAVAKHQYDVMLNYYFFQADGTLTQALKDQGVVDVDAIVTQVNAGLTALNAAQGVVGSLPSVGPISNLQLAMQQANTSISNSLAAKDKLLADADYNAVHPLYVSLKNYACCEVFDIMRHLWMAFTAAAWLMLLLIWLCFGLVHLYDVAPGGHAGGFCGGCWVCHSISPFPPRGSGTATPMAGQAAGSPARSSNSLEEGTAKPYTYAAGAPPAYNYPMGSHTIYAQPAAAAPRPTAPPYRY